MTWPGAVHYWVDDDHGCSSTTVDAGCLQQEKQLEKKLGPRVPIMSTHGGSAEVPIMAVGSAEEQCIMSTSMRLQLKRRPNIIKDAAQSFSSSGVSNKWHDGGVLQSLGFCVAIHAFAWTCSSCCCISIKTCIFLAVWVLLHHVRHCHELLDGEQLSDLCR